MELWDVYDRSRRLTGEQMKRGSAYKDGAYHLVVHVCLFNAAGEMLIQQRQPFKTGWPNYWDVTVGGSALAGETSSRAAEREVLEEIGCSLDLQEERPALTVNFEHGFDDIYLLEKEVAIADLQLQYEEVQQVKWATCQDIVEMIDSGQFIPYYKSFIALLFELRNQRGTHRPAR